MLPGFEDMYMPILMILAVESPQEISTSSLRTELLAWFHTTPEELAQMTTGERRRKDAATVLQPAELFGKRLSFAEYDLRKANAILKFKGGEGSYVITKIGIELLKRILQNYSKGFNRKQLVVYSKDFAESASHHRNMMIHLATY